MAANFIPKLEPSSSQVTLPLEPYKGAKTLTVTTAESSQ